MKTLREICSEEKPKVLEANPGIILQNKVSKRKVNSDKLNSKHKKKPNSCLNENDEDSPNQITDNEHISFSEDRPNSVPVVEACSVNNTQMNTYNNSCINYNPNFDNNVSTNYLLTNRNNMNFSQGFNTFSNHSNFNYNNEQINKENINRTSYYSTDNKVYTQKSNTQLTGYNFEDQNTCDGAPNISL